MRPLKIRRISGAALLTAVVCASRFFPTALLENAVTGLAASSAHLIYPWTSVLLTPWSTIADLFVCQSAPVDLAFLVFLLTFGFLFFRFFWLEPELEGWLGAVRSFRALGLYIVLVALFLVWAVLVPRPAARLRAVDSEDMIVDFHSHSSASWDGRKSFFPARNILWHEARGFDAAFITDHNVFAGSAQANAQTKIQRGLGISSYASLTGEELSLSGAHVVAIGNRALIDTPAFSDGTPGLELFLKKSRSLGAFAIMSLPEYSEHHWAELEKLADWGAGGFEIVTTSPKGLNFSSARRQAVIELSRRRNLPVIGASDNHGYGSSCGVWNLIHLPGWRSLDQDELERVVVRTLSERGFSAVEVVTRPRIEPSEVSLAPLDGFRSLWLMARQWSGPQALFALLWIWVLAVIPGFGIDRRRN